MAVVHDAEIDRWIAAHVITPDQGEAIRRMEAETEHATTPPPRVSLIVEAIGFLGGTLAAIAGIVATSRFWDHFATPTRLALVGGVVALLVAAGALVRRGDQPALDHLASFLWLVATGASAFWGGLLAVDVLDWTGPDVALVVGLTALALAATLWFRRPAPLQHLATFAAMALTVGSIAGQVEHVGAVDVGITLWAFGLTWATLGWLRVVKPVPIAYALGAAVTIGGMLAVASESNWGEALAVVTALGLLAASVPARSIVLLWAGVAGVFLSVPRTIFEHLGDSAGAPAALFLVGAALIAVAIVASRLVREVRTTAQPVDRRRDRNAAVVLLVGVGVTTALTVGITQAQLVPVPQFHSVAVTPDMRITGNVGFLRRSGAEPCVYVMPANAQSRPLRLWCDRNLADEIGWNDAGNLLVVEYSDTGEPRLVELNPRTGSVLSRTTASDSPLFKEKGLLVSSASTRKSDGAVLEIDNRDGKARLRVRSTDGSVATRFAVRGPSDYHFQQAIWSGDGSFALITDSEHRLLVVDIDATYPSARVLATDASGAAWSR